MIQTYRVIISPRAIADLDGIFQYISTDSPQNAHKMVETILDAIDSLEILPYRYAVPRVGRVRGQTLRAMPVGRYIIRYRVDELLKSVFILSARHGARRRP